ncbi:YhgE/Pip domain-containing protein [Anoxybacillus rupiensis]|uniref:YhgE/Pip domain-containing protein n=1 Tax=Anoxybacteroides rupiense TaxID=311460 RepID=UPI001BAD1133|nr:YhgE/Pip domain-containing protein [Anoxybacillus rupiensis]MBS2771747.1 YhgE/Pip domain-containing protein [Anoxybacillus rupiensis]
MKEFSLLLQEIKSIATNRKILIPIIAILFIPLMYSGMFLWAFWDPYGQLDKLPVAVVNHDKGAVLNGEKLEIGNELVKKLKEKNTFAWHFVSQKEANKGLKQRKYYMVVEIPENFSENATTLQNEHPKQMEIVYKPNEGMNFLSAQIGNKAVEAIKEEISRTVTATYAEAMLENVQKMAKGLQEASAGAKQLNNGMSTAEDGAVQLQKGLHSAQTGGSQLQKGIGSAKTGAEAINQNLTFLAEKSAAFENGVKSASEGSQRLNDGLQQLNGGLGRIHEGQSQLLNGAKQTEGGTKSLLEGIQQSLSGMEQLQEALPSLTNGSLQLKEGSGELSASLSQWQQGAESTKDGAMQVSNGLEQVVTELDGMIAQAPTEEEKAKLQTLKNQLQPLWQGSKRTTEGIGQLTASATALKAGADQLAEGALQLYSGENAFNQGFKQVIDGQQKLAEGASALVEGQGKVIQGLAVLEEKTGEAKAGTADLANGSHQLSNGLQELADGSGRLKDGASQLANGSSQLAGGMTALENGASQLLTGMNRLTDGSNQLVNGMEKLDNGSGELAQKLTDGAKESRNVKANNEVYHMFAEPVKLKTESIHHVPNYGTGMAPYLLSLGLYVGALLSTIVFPLRSPAGVPRSGLSWFISKFGVMMLIGTVQALLADLVLLIGLGVHVQSAPRFIIFSIIVSFAFMALIQFLVTTLEDPGRFIGIIILILQLSASAGTFPIELVPKALQHVTAYLPMTYSIQGFRSVISSGDFSFMWENAAILAIYLVFGAFSTALYFIYWHKRKFHKTAKQMTEAPQA